ncbi:MAG: MAPEG family protein [Pseudomonadota bacterium]
MTLELWSLLGCSVLVASLWIPYIVGVNLHLPHTEAPGLRPPDTRLLPDWVQRANRAHINLVEQFAPFAALVLLSTLTGLSSPMIGWAAIAFLGLRIAHAIGYITARAQLPLRPIIFTGAWLCLCIIAFEIARLALMT